MTRKELEKLIALKDVELASLVVTDQHQIENITVARDDALARIATATATATATSAAHAKQLGEAKQSLQDEQVKHDATVKHWQEQLERQRSDYELMIGNVKASHDAETAKLKDALAAMQTKLADAEQLIVALGGTELGQKMAREARATKIKADIATAQAELDSLAG